MVIWNVLDIEEKKIIFQHYIEIYLGKKRNIFGSTGEILNSYFKQGSASITVKLQRGKRQISQNEVNHKYLRYH